MVQAGVAVATGVIAARVLGPTGEGELAAIQTWPMLLATIAMLGIPEALVFYISRTPERSGQFVSTAVTIAMASSLLVGVVAWVFLPDLLSAQRPSVIAAARVFLAIGPLYALVGIPHGALRGARLFVSWNVLRLFPNLVWLGVLISALVIGHGNAIVLSRLFLLGTAVTGFPALIIVRQRLRGKAVPDPHLAPSLLRFGLPSVLTTLPQTINLRLDQLLIVAFLPARSLGLYVVAVAWSGALAPLLSAVGSVLFPHVSAEHGAERQSQMLSTALQGGMVVAIAGCVVLMALAPLGVPLVFGSRFARAVPAAMVLVPAGAILAWAAVAKEGLRGLGRPTVVLIAEVLAAVVTVATLPVLLSRFGIVGASVASLLGYATVGVFTAVAISRIAHLPLRSLVVPTWSSTKSTVHRSISLLRGRRRGRDSND